ncbi:MAG: APC family permease [Rhodospirillales bacterium]|nr:APC family permease [Acetobacter sp.]
MSAVPQNSLLAPEQDDSHHLPKQMQLRDLVLAQVLTVVGSSWVGLAAGLGRAQLVAWLIAFALFYLPMAVAVFYLNREMPLEGGLYIWARRAFGDAPGFLTAWNIWVYGLAICATILFQIPSELSYMLGPGFATLPENRPVVGSLLLIFLVVLAWSARRGLGLGKWIHNFSGASMIAVFCLLIVSPVWALAHGEHLHYAPFALHLPARDPTSFSLLGQVLFAASGLEYIAIMAGETHAANRDIGRSVVLATPVIFLMFVLGTGSVLSFHEQHPALPINYVAPIPQALTFAFGERGIGAIISKIAILLLQIRILGAASFIFTGVVRLPMAAGWDHLVPTWFGRLHPRFRTPVNSILVSTLVIGGLLVLGSAGVHAAEAFNVLNDTASEFYALAYLAMFLIPLTGAPALRVRLPRWVAWACALGVLTIIFCLLFNAYPFVNVASPGWFASKILGTTAIMNGVGYLFYRLRSRPTPLS